MAADKDKQSLGFVAGGPSLPVNPVIECYKQKVDRAALDENLKLTVEQRLEKLMERIRPPELQEGADREG